MPHPTYLFPPGSLAPKRHHRERRRKATSRVYPMFSAEDADLANLKWYRNTCGKGYAYKTHRDGGKTYIILAHRIVLARILNRPITSTDECDHKYGATFDCRRSELRLATHQLNMQNRGPSRNNTTGYRNVTYIKSRNCYRVHVKCGTRHYQNNEKTLAAAIAKAAEVRREFGFPEDRPSSRFLFANAHPSVHPFEQTDLSRVESYTKPTSTLPGGEGNKTSSTPIAVEAQLSTAARKDGVQGTDARSLRVVEAHQSETSAAPSPLPNPPESASAVA